MKIPEWLPDTQHPIGPEQEPRKALIEPWMRHVTRFLHIQAAGGFVLLACTILALIVANSPWSAGFAEVWQMAVKLGLARLPSGVNWKILLGAGCLAGIGFTMSLFIAGLALEAELLSAGKVGTLFGSALSAILGLGLLKAFLRRGEGHQAVGAGIATSRPSSADGKPVSTIHFIDCCSTKRHAFVSTEVAAIDT